MFRTLLSSLNCTFTHPNQICYRGSTIILVPRPTPLASTRETDQQIFVAESEQQLRPDSVQLVSPADDHHSGTGTTASPKPPGRSTNADLQDSSCVLLYSPAHKGNPVGATRHPAESFGELLREEETNNQTTKAKTGQSLGRAAACRDELPLQTAPCWCRKAFPSNSDLYASASLVQKKQ